MLYKAEDEEVYEVFELRFSPRLVDFESRQYSDTDFVSSVPGNESFGKWAWSYSDYSLAIKKLNS